MIISHQHQFIFVKTEKTAGTSIEIALSKFCGPDDVISRISPDDERKRAELGYRGAQNYRIPPWRYTKADWAALLRRGKAADFFNHASARYIRAHIDPEIWERYFTFTVERNPWDKAVSWYYYTQTGDDRPSLSEFVCQGGANRIRGFELYSEDGEIVVDRVFRYEDLEGAMQELRERLGLPETPTLPKAKGGFRPKRRSYREEMDEAARDAIARQFVREIAAFGYQW